ncbi:MAG: hypothetical protein K8H88_13815 [Sandaracinaceae bacterium]|nr:hypothetical protein [Sandaracinaceae bacterium]
MGLFVLALGCDGGGECLIPCLSRLEIAATLPTAGAQPLSVDVCDGPMRCGSTSAQSGGECVTAGDFVVCLEGLAMTITRSYPSPFNPPPDGGPALVTLTVRGSDGTVILMEEGYATQRFEEQCGGFPCPQRSITF